MKCKLPSSNKTATSGLWVRRKFVPIQLTIHRENQFVNASAKLPFTTAKVIGVLPVVQVEQECSDTPVPPRLYYGLSDTLVDDDRFLQLSTGTEYTTTPPDATLSREIYSGLYWYYAHPATDTFPYLYEDDFMDRLTDPKIIEVLEEGQCSPVEYYLWSGPFIGYVLITHNEYT